TVLEVSADGLRIFNEGDTLMVISSTEIKAFIANSKDKALSRSFSVTTSTTGKGTGDVVNIDTDGLRVYNDNDKLMDITASNITAYIDTSSTKALSRSFSVTTSTTGKENVDVLEVSTGATRMRDGTEGDQYTDFSTDNIFLGLNSGISTTPSLLQGNSNVFVGNQCGFTNTIGNKNVFIGNQAGYTNNDGDYNVFVGHNAGYFNESGSFNVFIGFQSGNMNTTGVCNTFVGESSGYKNTEGTGNSIFGFWAGVENTLGAYNTKMGFDSGYSGTTGNYNSYYGAGSGVNNQTGSSNSVFGYNAGKGTFGNSYSSNSFFGYRSGFSNRTGSFNSCFGQDAGYSNTVGSRNVFLGYQAGYSETGSDKLYIANTSTTTPLIEGTFPNTDLTFTTSKVSIIHPTGTENGLYFQNTYLGNTDTWHFYQYTTDVLALFFNSTKVGEFNNISGAYTATSDLRSKKNIIEMTKVLDRVMLLQPKKYNFISQKDNEQKYMGFIAQEVEKIFPSLAQYNDEDDTYTLDYAGFSVVAIQAIKEQQKEINNLKSDIEEIKKLLNK
ncbi:MAG: tail fiber domain-containing protein, partial [Candidatus Delongbacteria bacterium]|nr:tail fiber domain-containing protein [Candidatus Delongbacteria bacterium]